jgi:hypothetical protein
MAGFGPAHPRLGHEIRKGVDGRQSSMLRIERLDTKTGA